MKKGDFMPYENQEHKYWTGYYSTRPNLKHMIRKSGRFLSIIRTLFGLEMWKNGREYQEIFIDNIDKLEKQMALC